MKSVKRLSWGGETKARFNGVNCGPLARAKELEPWIELENLELSWTARATST